MFTTLVCGVRGGAVGGFLAVRPHRLDSHFQNVVGPLVAILDVPQSLTVIAIDGLDNVCLRVELHPHLAEVVAKQHADLAAHRRVVQAVRSRCKHVAAFGDEAVGIGKCRVEQCPCEPGKKRRRGEETIGCRHTDRATIPVSNRAAVASPASPPAHLRSD